MKVLQRIGADLIFLIHFLVVLIALFGWTIPAIWVFYMATLVSTLTSEVLLGYCFLSRWEFALRKKLDPSTNYDYAFSSYYTNKLTHQRFAISTDFIKKSGLIFLAASLLINIYFRL
jgi:hypothetical protein